MNTILPKFIVGIGGSAGGLVVYKAFLDALSPRTGMSFVIISHLLANATSQLADILSKHTSLPVAVALNGMQIRENCVYVCPPNADLIIEEDAFTIVTPRAKRNTQIDMFFTSLALARGPRAIGIIFSGYDGDGSVGCMAIRSKGGTIFVQDASAEISDMPLSARATGVVDYILSPEKIANRLLEIAMMYVQ